MIWVSLIFRWIGWPGIVGIAVWLFFTGVPLLGWWPFSLVFDRVPVVGYVIEGEIARRIEAHDAQKSRLDALRAKRAAEALAKSIERRMAIVRLNEQLAAQSRVDLATGEASERERFLEAQRREREARIRQLETALQSETCQPEVIIRNVENLVPQSCPYPGDAAPSSSFMREYRRLNR